MAQIVDATTDIKTKRLSRTLDTTPLRDFGSGHKIKMVSAHNAIRTGSLVTTFIDTDRPQFRDVNITWYPDFRIFVFRGKDFPTGGQPYNQDNFITWSFLD